MDGPTGKLGNELCAPNVAETLVRTTAPERTLVGRGLSST